MVYLITYDLNKAGQNYDKLYEAIKAFGGWWHYLDSTWLVSTNLSATQMRDLIIEHMAVDKNDYLFIVKITKTYDGWLPEDAWTWIRKHIVNNPT